MGLKPVSYHPYKYTAPSLVATSAASSEPWYGKKYIFCPASDDTMAFVLQHGNVVTETTNSSTRRVLDSEARQLAKVVQAMELFNQKLVAF